jgi:hypothetical protein
MDGKGRTGCNALQYRMKKKNFPVSKLWMHGLSRAIGLLNRKSEQKLYIPFFQRARKTEKQIFLKIKE